eukprot:Platyproteum_vivax@DN4083_c0_g1_i1.p1
MAPLTLFDVFRVKYANIMNWLGVVGVLYAAVLVCYKSIRAGLNPPAVYFSSDPLKILYAIPILTCAFCCHHNMFSTISSLKDRSEKNIGIISFASQIFPFFLYSCVTIFGYLQLGNEVESNMMNSYDSQHPPVYIAKLALTVSMCTTFPLNFHPARAALLTLTQPLIKKFNKNMVAWVYAGILMGGALAIACAIRDLDIVFSVMSITATIPIMFILPGLYYVRMYTATNVRRILSFILMVYGVVIVPVSLGIFINHLLKMNK